MTSDEAPPTNDIKKAMRDGWADRGQARKTKLEVLEEAKRSAKRA